MQSALDSKVDTSEIGNRKTYYGTCSTAASTQIKEVDCPDFELENGNTIDVQFTYSQNYDGIPQIKIIGDANVRNIYYGANHNGEKELWKANEIVRFIYRGGAYYLVGKMRASTTDYGITKLNDIISTSTTTAATPRTVKAAYDLANGKQDKITNSNKLSYTLLTDTPTIPTKVSDLTNDSGFITNTVNNLTNYYTKTNTYSKSEVDSLISTVGSLNIEVVQTLPTHDISTSTIYLVPKTAATNDNYDEYIYVNNNWENIGSTEADLTNYYTKTQTDTLLDAKADSSDVPTKTSDLTNDSGYITTETDPVFNASAAKNITSANITSWNNKSDFSGNYNDLTNKPTIPSEVTEATVSGWGFTKNTGTYSKPSGGIPKTDLASAVQTSLGKADTALQSFTETDPIFNASAAKNITSTDITNWNNKSTFSGSYSDLTNKPIYDASYVESAIGQTITNEQFDELRNACNNENIINVGGFACYYDNPYGNPIRLWFIDNYNIKHVISVSKTANNHTVTEDEETLLSEDNIGDYVGPVYANMAQFYDSTSTYNVGDYVWGAGDNPIIYKCTTAITTPEDWDSTKWTQVITMEEIKDKQDTLVSGTNIKTINSTSLLGSGNIDTNQITNSYSNSTTNGYSCNYVNNAIGFTYSTSEVDTGKKWVDGSTIYRKSYTGTAVKSGSKTIDTISTLNHIIAAYGSSNSLYDWKYNIPAANADGYSCNYRFSTSTKQLQLVFGAYYDTSLTFVFTIEYTKTS